MFIRSKFEKMVEMRFVKTQNNPPINMDLISSPIKKDLFASDSKTFYISFKIFGKLDYLGIWSYDSKEDRDQEYEWIMKQLGCKVNDGIVENPPSKPPEPVKRPTNPYLIV